MATVTAPSEARQAMAKVLLEHHIQIDVDQATMILEAVTPHIAKAERMRVASSFGDMLTVLGNSPDEAVAVTARLLKEGFDQQIAAWR